MLIKNQLSQKEFIRVNLQVLYSRKAIQILTGLMLFAIVVVPLMPLIVKRPADWGTMIAPILILFFLPGSTYYSARKNYDANKQLGEPTTYTFEQDSFTVKGESYSAIMEWNNVYKVTKTKDYLLIWTSEQIASILALKNFSDAQIIELKRILDANEVPNPL